jgi:hypothetical protein
MPYFKREVVVDVGAKSNLVLLGRTAPSPVPQSADAAAMQSIVARASAVLEAAAGADGKLNMPWPVPAVVGAAAGSAEQLLTSVRAFLSNMGPLPGFVQSVSNLTPESGGDVPALPPRSAVRGADALIELRIANDDAAASTVTFVSTTLLSPEGDSIGAHAVSFLPAHLSVPGGGQAAVEIRVAVPERARTGAYSGLILSTGNQPLQAVVTVQVK